MTIAQSLSTTRSPFKEDRINDIYDIQSLKKYACQKVKYLKDWYLKCVDCPDKSCRVGKQVSVIMENETMPEETDPIRKQIVDIFSQKDPLKALLTSFSQLRPPSVYAKVNSWRRRHPDLEERYHMIEKVRFLWTKQYESMTIPDILKQLYPSDSEIADSDDISLEEFLSECEEKEEADVDLKETPPVSDSMDILLKNLYSEKSECEIRLQEIQRQIDAVNTVKELMRNATAQKG